MAELRAQGVVSLDMETAAIAHLCDERGIPWSVFRVISDRPDSNITEELFQMSNLDMTPNQEAIDAYFAKHPDALETLAKLGEDATLAANNAADAAIRACSPSTIPPTRRTRGGGSRMQVCRPQGIRATDRRPGRRTQEGVLSCRYDAHDLRRRLGPPRPRSPVCPELRLGAPPRARRGARRLGVSRAVTDWASP